MDFTASSDVVTAAWITAVGLAVVAALGGIAKYAQKRLDARSAAKRADAEQRRVAHATYERLHAELAATLTAVTRGQATTAKAADAFKVLQGHGKGEFRTAFDERSAAVWGERRVRSLMDGALGLLPAVIDEAERNRAWDAATDEIDKLEERDLISGDEAEARYDAVGDRPGEPAARHLVGRLTVISDAGMTHVLRPEALAAIARPGELITIDESTASSSEDRKLLEELTAKYGGHAIDEH